jgi:hypothetical protein
MKSRATPRRKWIRMRCERYKARQRRFASRHNKVCWKWLDATLFSDVFNVKDACLMAPTYFK